MWIILNEKKVMQEINVYIFTKIWSFCHKARTYNYLDILEKFTLARTANKFFKKFLKM